MLRVGLVASVRLDLPAGVNASSLLDFSWFRKNYLSKSTEPTILASHSSEQPLLFVFIVQGLVIPMSACGISE
jgi:hypothetical protein